MITNRPVTRHRRMRRIAVGACAALAVIGAVPASADPPPASVGNTFHGFLADDGVVTPIDHPDATTVPATPDGIAGTVTTGINDRGEILGTYEDRDRRGVGTNFVLDRKGRFTEIDGPPGGNGMHEYVDMNNRRDIVGFYNDDTGATTTGFLRSRRGRFTSIDVPDSQVTGPLKVNDRRQVVGIYVDADGALHGFVWDNGEYRTIDVPGATATAPTGINNRGQIVGSYIDADGAYHGFVRSRRGAVRTLPEAPGADPTMGGTQPASINERGQVVGLAYDARGGSRAFLLQRGVFTLFDAPGAATYTRALDINNRGQIVGDYDTEPAVAASPEPEDAQQPTNSRPPLDEVLPGPRTTRQDTTDDRSLPWH